VQLGALAIILPNLLAMHRVIFRSALQAIRRRGWNLRHVTVIGVGRLGRIVCRTLDRNTWTGIHVAHFLSHQEHNNGAQQCVGRPVLGGLADLESVLEKEKPDAVYLAIPNARSAVVPGVLKRLERFAVDVRIVPDVHPRYMPQNMQVGMLEGMPVLSVRESPLNGMGGLVKRALDFFGALAALLVFAPLMLATAAVVRLTSPGPVIFRQRRVSLGGETFNIYKFRTMFHAEDEQHAPAGWTQRNDPRITPVGRWLRKTSLDELPQLFNVLLGDMSLVGPRPERPELIQRFRDDWRGYMLRQHVKAGITGWAQVNGLRGDTSIRKRLQLDLFYIRHWSLGFDLKMLWLTLFRGFVHRNAH
jgi:Undecaprenyl-phosphate glucose phosphotransferase